MTDLQRRIVTLIEAYGGLKSTNLILKLYEDNKLSELNIKNSILECVAGGMIVEIEYTIGNKSYSFFVPKDTRIDIVRVIRYVQAGN